MDNEKAIMALAVMGVALCLIGSPIVGNAAGLIGIIAGAATGGVATAVEVGLVVDGFVVAAALAPASGGLSLLGWGLAGL